jgi:hypothetical protein
MPERAGWKPALPIPRRRHGTAMTSSGLDFARNDDTNNAFEIDRGSKMKSRNYFLLGLTLGIIASAFAVEPANFDGEYADKKFLNGQAVFEFSVYQSGNALEIAFDAAYSDSHGATPDATGSGKVTGNTAKFAWKDSAGNSGNGTITRVSRAGDDIMVSLKPGRVADSRCLVFYRENMRLKRIGKK